MVPGESLFRGSARVSPQTHRRIDLLTFPALLAAAAVLSRRDRRAAGVVLATAAVEGVATATTNYPPPVLGGALNFRAYNLRAASHGLLVAALAHVADGYGKLSARCERQLREGIDAEPIRYLAGTHDCESAVGRMLRQKLIERVCKGVIHLILQLWRHR